jgi:hypothetical protein
MARRRRHKTAPAHVREDNPDYDAKEYLSDAVKVCLQNSHLMPEDLDPEKEDADAAPLKQFEQSIRDNPEQLVEAGLLTEEGLETEPWEKDPKLVEEGAARLYEQWIDSEIRMRDEDERRLGPSFEDDDEFEKDVNESPAIIREALRDVRAALASADPEEIVRVLDILFEETGQQPDDETIVEHWAEQLAGQPLPQNKPTPGPSETHRAVVAAVKGLAVRLCELIAQDGTALRHIEWRHLEEVVATALEGIGFSVELTRPSKDGGKDVVVSCTLKGRRCTFYVEVKHWRSGKRVGAAPILDFVEINVSAGTAGGLFLSTSGYQDTIWTQLSEVERTTVQLGDGEKVVSLCQHFTRRGRGLWDAEGMLPTLLFKDTHAFGRHAPAILPHSW